MDDTSVKLKSNCLSGYKVTIAAGGGIAAVEIPRLARELRRHGAQVFCYVTENCLKFIGAESLAWASNNPLVVHPSGRAEHICTSDAVVVVPATADLISKIRHGICSDGVTTLVQSALGQKKPVLFCPTMHNSLANSPIISENRVFLSQLKNVFFLDSRKEEGKEKIPAPEILALNISHHIRKSQFQTPPHVLLTLGGTRVMLDPVRCLTNLSTGGLGVEVLKCLFGYGVQLTVLKGLTEKEVPLFEGVQYHHLPNYNDIYTFANHLEPTTYQGFIHLLAASDFSPMIQQTKKISSQQEKLILEFAKNKKILDIDSLKQIPYQACAKLTEGQGDDEKDMALHLLKKRKLNAVFWNGANQVWNFAPSHSGIFIERNEGSISETPLSGKNQIATAFYQSFVNFLKAK